MGAGKNWGDFRSEGIFIFCDLEKKPKSLFSGIIIKSVYEISLKVPSYLPTGFGWLAWLAGWSTKATLLGRQAVWERDLHHRLLRLEETNFCT